MIEAMIDIETLDTADTAVVFQIGLVIFEGSEILENHFWNLDVQEQLDRGRTVSASTVQFWLNPRISAVAYHALGPEGAAVATNKVLALLHQLLRHREVKQVWAKGSFDFNLLENLWAMYLNVEDIDVPVPWKFYQCRDLRTLMKECGVKKQDVVSHNALSDCQEQLTLLIECRAKING